LKKVTFSPFFGEIVSSHLPISNKLKMAEARIILGGIPVSGAS